MLMFIYKNKIGETISNVGVNKEDIYLPHFYYNSFGYHIYSFVLSPPNSEDNIKILLTPKNNLMIYISPEKKLFSKNALKLPQETLVKTTIENYIKKLTVSFVNESYFLYDKGNLIKQTSK